MVCAGEMRSSCFVQGTLVRLSASLYKHVDAHVCDTQLFSWRARTSSRAASYACIISSLILVRLLPVHSGVADGMSVHIRILRRRVYPHRHRRRHACTARGMRLHVDFRCPSVSTCNTSICAGEDDVTLFCSRQAHASIHMLMHMSMHMYVWMSVHIPGILCPCLCPCLCTCLCTCLYTGLCSTRPACLTRA